MRFALSGFLAVLALAASAFASEPELTLEQRCDYEIRELHRFLEEWSNAELPDTDEAFARFADVLAPSFWIVDPDGSQAGREPIVDAIRRAHGRWREAPGKIRIENVRLHQAGPGFALATYEEWHDLPGGGNGRLSSVLFGEDESAPFGLVWLHLHEVWLPTDAEAP